MQDFTTWWSERSTGERIGYTIAVWTLTFWGGIEIGRALFQATH